MDDSVVVADFQGYVHWLDKASGAIIARTHTGKMRVSNTPVVVGDMVLVDQRPRPDQRLPRDPASGRAKHPAPPRPHRGRRAAVDGTVTGAPRRQAAASSNSPPQRHAAVVALVGRPNVGKSTLFNVLTGTRDAIVADVPGLTRDRQYGYGALGPVPCVVIDTGGLVENPVGIEAQMRAQTERAVAEADRLVFMADARAGLSPQD